MAKQGVHPLTAILAAARNVDHAVGKLTQDVLALHNRTVGTNGWTDERRVNMLISCLGAEGQIQYEAIENQGTVGTSELEKAIDLLGRLRETIVAKKGLTAATHEFTVRDQRAGETI